MNSLPPKLLAFGLGFVAATAFAATLPPLPDTPRGDTVDIVQGVRVADPYRWLENWDDKKVQSWSDAQNRYARAYLQNLPDRAAVKAELTRLIGATSPSYSRLEARGDLIFAYYNDPKYQQPMIVTLDATADPASRKVLLDPNVLDSDGLTAIDWFAVSPDGKHMAVSLSQNGSEDGTLHLYDVATGKEIDRPIPRVQYPTAGGSLAWTQDGQSFWYTRFPGEDAPESERHFNQQVYFHRLGSDWRKDALALGAGDGLPRTAEVFLANPYGAADAFASVQLGDGGEWQHYVLHPDGSFEQLARYEDKIVAATPGPDGALYGISRKDAPNGKIVKLVAPYRGGFAAAKTIVPESDVAIVSEDQQQALALTGTKLFVRDIIGGPSQVRIFDHDGGKVQKLSLPEVSAVDEIVPLKNGNVLYAVSTYLRPRYYAQWDAATGQSKETGLAVISPVSFDDAEIVRVFATSKDGTKVPVNIIRKKGTPLDGRNPTLLYGYGGYGVNMTPAFLGAMRRLWLDAGGVYAVANIRGGAEYGERWHREGMLTNKQNVFDDFLAAANYLIDAHYTSHDRLALMGGSNGGLLMGATITQNPGLARAVISAVGIYDMVRVERDPNGSFNTAEFGTVRDPAQFKALYAYSPYHHVTDGAAYPALLMLTGATDGRVNPMHSRKFAAALQAASSSGYPVLLRTSANSGHGIGTALSARIAEQTDDLTFLFDQLGMPWREERRQASTGGAVTAQ